MSVTLHDSLNASVVLLGVDLLPTPESMDELKQAIQTDILVTVGIAGPQPSGDVEEIRTLRLDRERVEMTMQGSRSTVLRQHPEGIDLPRLAEITSLALSLSQLKIEVVEAVRYSVELVFEQDSGQVAGRYVAERLFDYQPGEGDLPLWGGAARMVFGTPEVKQIFTVESRFGDDQTSRLFISANLHLEDRRIPSEDEIRESLEQIWRDAHRFMERLDQKGAK